jgi:SAM-dependent methyltransferase
VPLNAGAKAVNLGCGSSTAPGWINLDNSPGARLAKHPRLRWALWKFRILSDAHYAVPWPSDLIIHDLTKPLPFSNNEIDFVYSSHALEHLYPADGARLIADAFRVLKPGGMIRIVVPDLYYGVSRYIAMRDAASEDATAAAILLNWLQLSKPGHRDPHLWMYDAASLTDLLRSSGFVEVTVCNHKCGRMPDVNILDNRPDDSLHVEAVKPVTV